MLIFLICSPSYLPNMLKGFLVIRGFSTRSFLLLAHISPMATSMTATTGESSTSTASLALLTTKAGGTLTPSLSSATHAAFRLLLTKGLALSGEPA